MKSNKSICMILATWIVFGWTVSFSAEEEANVLGVFGVSDIGQGTSLAFWVPLGEGESVSGVRWFNNDGNVVFPEFLAVAGDPGEPERLSDATVVATEVSGSSLQYSEIFFEQPLASSAEGLYLIWRLPASEIFIDLGEGGGAGFGYLAGGGENLSWISEDGTNWEAFTVDHQLAMNTIMGTNKASSGALVLHKPEPVLEPEADLSGDIPGPIQGSIRAIPNPFNPSTTLHFSLPKSGRTVVSVFDIKGRLVRTLIDNDLSAGEQTVHWDGQRNNGRPASSGIYLVRVEANTFEESTSITLVK